MFSMALTVVTDYSVLCTAQCIICTAAVTREDKTPHTPTHTAIGTQMQAVDAAVSSLCAEIITDQMVHSLLMTAFPLQSHVVSNIVACKANQHLPALVTLIRGPPMCALCASRRRRP